MVICILGMLMGIVIPYYVKQRATAQASACINNLFKIESASFQFALEQGKKTGDSINFPADLKPYLKLTQGGEIPACPAGGTYLIPLVGDRSTCSLSNSVDPAHILP